MCGWFAMRIDARPTSRRQVLRALFAAAGVGATASARAAGEAGAFDARSLAAALDSPGTPMHLDDPRVTLTLPELADNGAVVPVSVGSRIAGAQEIFIVVEHNPQPVAVRFSIPEGTEAFVSTRIKLAGSGVVHAAVLADGRLHCASRSAQVLVGGCG